MEVELTPKTAQRTAAVMAELLGRARDFGDDSTHGSAGPRYARVLYACAPAARGTVTRARAMLPADMAARVEIRALPAGRS